MEPLVSVIVPVYKTEAYIRQCVDSILEQTVSDLELILVDDGSPDGCGAICDEYAAKDPRVTVIHQSNGGISAARNRGLDQAKGRYLCYVDSDDFLERDFLEVLLGAGDADILAGGTRKQTDTGTVLEEQVPPEAFFDSGEKIRQGYQDGSLAKWFMGPVAKLYRRETAAGLRFDTELLVAEDIVYNLNYLPLVRTLRLVPWAGYNVRENLDSTTHLLHRRYSKTFEHGYDTIDRKVREAKMNWGVLNEEADTHCPTAMRYYLEVSNLLRPGSPYTAKEIRGRIRAIHEDKAFIDPIRNATKDQLITRVEKLAKLSVTLNNPFLSMLLFKIMVKLGK